MSVAKSYEKYPVAEGPYEKDKKEYVKIKYSCCSKKTCSKCAGQGYYLKEIRWYPEKSEFNAKKAFGFEKEGYITLLTGCRDYTDEYFCETIYQQARFNLLFYWHVPGGNPIPDNLPSHIKPIRLNWSDISLNNKIFSKEEIQKVVDKLTYPENSNSSNFIGQIGDKYEGDLLVVSIKEISSYYGNSNEYIFEDEEKNILSWTTSARKLIDSEIYHLKGTIKEHLIKEGKKITVLTRCREV